MEKKTSTSTRSTSLLFPIIVVIAALVLIAAVLVLNWDKIGGGDEPEAPRAGGDGPGGQSAPADVQGPESIDLTSIENRDPDYPLAVGPVDAPVVLVVFSDFQCSFCARWSADTLPAMMNHVDASQLRIEWVDIALFGADSERAARAAYAAGLQGRYLDYHDALFADGQIRDGAELTDEALIETAGNIGLDIEQFEADFASPSTAEVIASHHEKAIDLGAMSTPAFILGGQPIVGAQPTEVFESAFQAALQGQ